jgi:hypothetical protein
VKKINPDTEYNQKLQEALNRYQEKKSSLHKGIMLRSYLLGYPEKGLEICEVFGWKCCLYQKKPRKKSN